MLSPKKKKRYGKGWTEKERFAVGESPKENVFPLSKRRPEWRTSCYYFICPLIHWWGGEEGKRTHRGREFSDKEHPRDSA